LSALPRFALLERKFKHPLRKGRIIVSRHRTLSPGVARSIAKQAGWSD
jgi:hypothetical protein